MMISLICSVFGIIGYLGLILLMVKVVDKLELPIS